MARLETGPVQCGDDWPGVFIRGDRALHFAAALHGALEASTFDPATRGALEGLAKTLQSCHARDAKSVRQIMKIDEGLGN